jgi:hypothetical protein
MSEAGTAVIAVIAALLGVLIGALVAHLEQSKRDRLARVDVTRRALYTQFLAAAHDAYAYAHTLRHDPAREYSEPAAQLARIMYDISEQKSQLENALEALSLVTSTDTQAAAKNVGEAVAHFAEGRRGCEPGIVWQDVLSIRAAKLELRDSMQIELGLR